MLVVGIGYFVSLNVPSTHTHILVATFTERISQISHLNSLMNRYTWHPMTSESSKRLISQSSRASSTWIHCWCLSRTAFSGEIVNTTNWTKKKYTQHTIDFHQIIFRPKREYSSLVNLAQSFPCNRVLRHFNTIYIMCFSFVCSVVLSTINNPDTHNANRQVSQWQRGEEWQQHAKTHNQVDEEHS